MTSPATDLTAPQGWQPWMAPVSTGGQAGSRVWGRDLSAEVSSGRESEPSSGSRWASTFAYGEQASGRLIHMNGRVYDYRLGRFLSVDPIISNPANPQAVNPYSYIGNNPLSGTDPTGYCAEGYAMETGSHVCTLTTEGAANKIGAGMANGSIGKDTATSSVAKTLKTTVEKVEQALTGAAGTFKAMLGIGSNGGGNNQGPTTNNTNATNEGSPTHTARKKDESIPPLLRRPDEAQAQQEPGVGRGLGDPMALRRDREGDYRYYSVSAGPLFLQLAVDNDDRYYLAGGATTPAAPKNGQIPFALGFASGVGRYGDLTGRELTYHKAIQSRMEGLQLSAGFTILTQSWGLSLGLTPARHPLTGAPGVVAGPLAAERGAAAAALSVGASLTYARQVWP